MIKLKAVIKLKYIFKQFIFFTSHLLHKYSLSMRLFILDIDYEYDPKLEFLNSMLKWKNNNYKLKNREKIKGKRRN